MEPVIFTRLPFTVVDGSKPGPLGSIPTKLVVLSLTQLKLIPVVDPVVALMVRLNDWPEQTDDGPLTARVGD